MISVGHYIPSYRPPHRLVTEQVGREGWNLGRAGIEYIPSTDCIGDIVIARNDAIHAAIDAGIDYLVMQDSDNYCPHPRGAILPMLETAAKHKATMVAAVVGLRQNPPRGNVEPPQLGGVYKATRAGTGLVLIDVARVRDWGHDGAFFMNVYDKHGRKKEPGQDIYFSRLLEQYGGELWADARIPTRHVQEDHESLFFPGSATASGHSQAMAHGSR